jgi:transposase
MDEASTDVFSGVRRLDVVEVGRRRRWSDEVKLRIVEEAFASGSSVVAAARRNGVDPSQIYEWRRLLCPHITRRAGGFVPLVVAPEPALPSSRGQMEVVCGNGRRIIVDRDVDVEALLRVVTGLER